jgi:XTP/dITP diphosphohydrolase
LDERVKILAKRLDAETSSARQKNMKEFDKFVEIVRKLRKECPWDREQTHESLRRCLLEESYEVLEAIDNKDMAELKKELGDLLLQVVFHSVMAEETKSFTLEEIMNDEMNKLISRHPHIFGDVKVANSDEVKANWEALKIKEGRKSLLDGVPKELPSLFRAYRIQEKASKVGFDWDDLQPVYDKILEEINELKQAIDDKKKGEDIKTRQEEIENEFGDVLFALVNYSRFLKINPEDALRKTVEKFIFRFHKIEEYAKEKNLNLKEMTLEEMDEVWNKAKGNLS